MSEQRAAHRVLVTVSGTIDPEARRRVAAGEIPRPDYLVIADLVGADLLDHAGARAAAGRVGRLIERLAGPHALLAWVVARRGDRYDAVLTDGEQVGLPLALLWRLRRRRTSHVMIGHILSVPAKRRLFRWLGLGRRIDAMVVYSAFQERFVVGELRFPADRVLRSPFMVDTAFFSPERATPRAGERQLIATAGLERRDYRTLIDAARDVDARFVVAAASNWSTRADSSAGVDLPGNVEVRSLEYVPLRQLYADAAFVVMPLEDVEFQAGVTTILEAMSMARPVVCSRTRGQTDVVVDGVNGRYVPAGDPGALRAAIEELLADPGQVATMGAAARGFATEACDVEVYARAVAGLVESAVALSRRA